MRYLMLIKHTEDYRGKTPPPGLMQAMGEFIGDYARQGKFIDGAGLKSSHEGKKIQLRDGKIAVVDGPFTESKELVGGFSVFELESDAEALVVARKFMELHQEYWPTFSGECELRPYQTAAPGTE